MSQFKNFIKIETNIPYELEIYKCYDVEIFVVFRHRLVASLN